MTPEKPRTSDQAPMLDVSAVSVTGSVQTMIITPSAGPVAPIAASHLIEAVGLKLYEMLTKIAQSRTANELYNNVTADRVNSGANTCQRKAMPKTTAATPRSSRSHHPLASACCVGHPGLASC